MTIEEYQLELTVLQQTDTNRAFESGFRTKKEWFDFIKAQENDEIADAIVNLAERAELPIETVAAHFDQSMIWRVMARDTQRKNKKVA